MLLQIVCIISDLAGGSKVAWLPYAFALRPRFLGSQVGAEGNRTDPEKEGFIGVIWCVGRCVTFKYPI